MSSDAMGWRACCEMIVEGLEGFAPDVALDSLKRAADVPPDELAVDPGRVFGEWLASVSDEEVEWLPGAWVGWAEGPFQIDEDFEQAGHAVTELFLAEWSRRSGHAPIETMSGQHEQAEEAK